MVIQVQCPKCQTGYSVGELSLGKRVKCRKCGAAIAVELSRQMSAADTSQDRHAESTNGGQLAGKLASAPQKIGRYEIRQRLGAGAFGAVYRAYDPVLKRDVALKLPHPGLFESDADKARFLREPQAAAQLRHPNIVPLYDAGISDGQFYIASAFIEGQTLAERLDRDRADFKPLTFQEIAQLVIKLAGALEYAHAQGIVHRDVKPANIMLDAKGEPLLMDFGLARLREAEDKLTYDGTVLGTPAYMAPEQAAGRHDEVGPAADQYSLGVVLYEMLCGERPFTGPPALVISLVINQEPASPLTHNAAVSRDLETICLKAMAKEPAGRYSSCAALAEDLRRSCAGEVICARPVSSGERAWRWCKRNPLTAGLLGIVLISLLGGTVASSTFALYARKQADEATAAAAAERRARDEALERLYVSEFLPIQRAWEDRDYRKLHAILHRTHPCDGTPDFRNWEWHYFRVLNTQPTRKFTISGQAISSLDWSTTGRYIATGGYMSRNFNDNWPYAFPIRIWDVNSGREVHKLADSGLYPRWSPNGDYIAAIVDAMTIKVWDAKDFHEVRSLLGHTLDLRTLAWSPDGTQLASGGGRYDPESRVRKGELKIWEIESGREVLSLPSTRNGVYQVAWSPDGLHLAVGYDAAEGASNEHRVSLVEPTTGKQLQSFPAWAQSPFIWNPDGTLIAQTDPNFFSVIRAQGVVDRCFLDGCTGSLAWDPSGKWLAGIGNINNLGALLKLWEPENSVRRTVLWFSSDKHASCAWSPHGHLLAVTASLDEDDSQIGVWDVRQLHADHIVNYVHGPGTRSRHVSWSHDGKRLVSGGSDGRIIILSDQGVPLSEFKVIARNGVQDVSANVVEWNDRDDRLLVLRGDGDIDIVNSDGGTVVASIQSLGDPIRTACWANTSADIVTGSESGMVAIWSMANQSITRSAMVDSGTLTAVAANASAQVLALANTNGVVRRWRYDTLSELDARPIHAGVITAIAFSPDGKSLASCGVDKTVKVWKPAESSTPQILSGHPRTVTSIAWRHDGERLVSGDEGGSVRVWHAKFGQELLRIRELVTTPTQMIGGMIDLERYWDRPITSVSWSPGGMQLAAGGQDQAARGAQGIVQVWTAFPDGEQLGKSK